MVFGENCLDSFGSIRKIGEMFKYMMTNRRGAFQRRYAHICFSEK